MLLFVAGKAILSVTTNYYLLLFSRLVAGLTQEPFHGIGAVIATELVRILLGEL